MDLIISHLNEEERAYFIPLPYNYTVSTNERQNRMFEAVDKGLGNEELRRLKNTIGSDITWSFITAKAGGKCFYTDFVEGIGNFIEEARIKYPNAKICAIGHSQGTQLFYSFFFDFLDDVDCFISMGSPISMNSGAYPSWGKVPITVKKWINFYHWMDFVSSKLQGCHPSPDIANFVTDYEVPSAWWKLLYKLPAPFCKAMIGAGVLAHVSYWSSDFVAKKIADEIKALINS